MIEFENNRNKSSTLFHEQDWNFKPMIIYLRDNMTSVIDLELEKTMHAIHSNE